MASETNTDTIGGFEVSGPDCAGCGKPLLVENAWMTDGCPCNTPLGVNSMNETRWRLLMQLQQQQAREIERLRGLLDGGDEGLFERRDRSWQEANDEQRHRFWVNQRHLIERRDDQLAEARTKNDQLESALRASESQVDALVGACQAASEYINHEDCTVLTLWPSTMRKINEALSVTPATAKARAKRVQRMEAALQLCSDYLHSGYDPERHGDICKAAQEALNPELPSAGGGK